MPVRQRPDPPMSAREGDNLTLGMPIPLASKSHPGIIAKHTRCWEFGTRVALSSYRKR